MASNNNDAAAQGYDLCSLCYWLSFNFRCISYGFLYSLNSDYPAVQRKLVWFESWDLWITIIDFTCLGLRIFCLGIRKLRCNGAERLGSW